MLFLGHEYSAQYWRAVGSGLVKKPRRSNVRLVSNELHLKKDVAEAVPALPVANATRPHVLVSSRTMMHRSKDIEYHLCCREIPPGSFCEVEKDVLVASPALCLLHAAQTAKPDRILPLIELCCEFLGGYSLCENTPRGFLDHAPFLTKKELDAFIEALPKRTRGVRMLKTALGFACSGSKSPRETECFIALTLPTEMGGYGLERPEVNMRVDVDDEDFIFSNVKTYFVDLCWRDAMVGFEYDGGFDHNDPPKVAADKRRRSVLAALGYSVIIADNETASDYRSFDQKARQVIRALELASPRYSGKEKTAQKKLHRYLFDPRHHAIFPFTAPIERL